MRGCWSSEDSSSVRSIRILQRRVHCFSDPFLRWVKEAQILCSRGVFLSSLLRSLVPSSSDLLISWLKVKRTLSGREGFPSLFVNLVLRWMCWSSLFPLLSWEWLAFSNHLKNCGFWFNGFHSKKSSRYKIWREEKNRQKKTGTFFNRHFLNRQFELLFWTHWDGLKGTQLLLLLPVRTATSNHNRKM